MSGWRVQRHYGFGAAHVALPATPHLAADGALSLRDELRDVGDDLHLRIFPLLLLALLAGSALFYALWQDRSYGDLEVVVIPREVQEPVMEEVQEIPPPPVEEIVQQQPEPVIEPPKPEPPKVVEKKPEPPPPPKVPEKKPEPRQVARVQPPKPVPKPAPRPQIDALPKAPVEKALAPPPVRRGNRVRETAMPKLALAPVAPAPDLAELPEDGGSRRFAAVRAPTPVARPMADLGPPIAARPLSAPAPEAPPARTRRQAPRGEASARPEMAPPVFAAAGPVPAAPAPASPAPRRSRPVAPGAVARTGPPSLEPALAAVAPPSPRAESAAPSQRAAVRDRTDRNAGSRSRSDHSGGRNLAAVPLASLAACVSDREEEALKRRLVAAVTRQSECVSPAGTYRFVETKNLNAFLMTIERAPGRPVADRCAELTHALACVAR